MRPAPTALAFTVALGASCRQVEDERFDTPLPIVVIDTQRVKIDRQDAGPGEFFDITITLREPGAGDTVSLDSPPTFTGHGGMRVRGNSSLDFDKKQYRLETWDASGRDVDVEWLGMPPEEDWILSGPFSDKSLMRNHLMYRWSRAIGRYAARSVFVELYVDDDGGVLSTKNYRGVYLMMEKPKRDSERIAVDKLGPGDASKPTVTGGYVLKRDWYDDDDPALLTTSLYDDALLLEYPAAHEVSTAQREYITGYLDAMEAALAGADFADPTTGYAAWIDVDSFVDHLLLVELGRTVDGYVLSTFMSKPRSGRLTMGPIWDYNGALGNADYFEAWKPDGWHYQNPEFPEDNPNGFRWYERLLEDPAFRSRVRDRWIELRGGPLSTENLMDDIATTAALLEGPAGNEGPTARNFERWEVLGEYVWPNDEAAENRTTYREEVEYLEGWLGARLVWIDQALQ